MPGHFGGADRTERDRSWPWVRMNITAHQKQEPKCKERKTEKKEDREREGPCMTDFR